MIRLIIGDDANVAEWVRRRMQRPVASFGSCTAIGVADGPSPIAGVVYHNWIESVPAVEMSIAAEHPKWAKRGIIKALLDYPFQQLGCVRVSAIIPIDNARALRFVRGIGFVQEGVARKGFGDTHAAVCGMTDDDHRKLFKRKARHGQRRTVSTAGA